MPRASVQSIREASAGYQLGIVQEVLLALLAKEASHAYELRARLALALGPLAEALNEGQVYVTLARLEKAGLVSSARVGQADRPDRKVYELTEAGRDRVTSWLEDVSWPKPAPAEFHLKLVAAAAAGLATRSGSWICSGGSCCSSCERRSVPRWRNPTDRWRRCCWKAWC